MIELFNEDCMVGMARYPDKYFELAIVDPPYGINLTGRCGRFERWEGGLRKANNNPPDDKYFLALSR